MASASATKKGPHPERVEARTSGLATRGRGANVSNQARLLAFRGVTRYAPPSGLEIAMAAAAERMRGMRERRRRRGLRELRLVVPDPRLRSVRRRVAAQVAALDRRDEAEALSWIEAVSEFDSPNDQ